MKKLLFPVLLLASPTFAQHIELGLNGGAATYSGFSSGFFSTTPSVVAPLTSLKAMYVTPHYQYGISADYRRISYTLTETIWGDLSYSPSGIPPAPVYVQSQVVNTQYPLRAFVNRTLSIGHIQLYGGAFAGYIFSQWQRYEADENIRPVHGGWMYCGAQAGATYSLTKHIGINAELEGDYNFTSKTYNGFFLNDYPKNKNRNVYPVSMGLRYSL